MNTRPALPAMLDCLRGYWSDARPAQRAAYLAGTVLLGVGLAHGLAWLVVGGSAVGPLSWRKPTTFGISFGLTTITLAWMSQFLRLTDRALRVTLGALVVAFSVEVSWVSLQHARGVASHFNESTGLDYALFLTAGAAILVAVGTAAVLCLVVASAAAVASLRAVRHSPEMTVRSAQGRGLTSCTGCTRGARCDVEPDDQAAVAACMDDG